MQKIVIIMISFLFFQELIAQGKIIYPESMCTDVIDNYHGVVVADPYRWMEEFGSDEISNWIKEQNKLTESYLSRIPYRDSIREDLTLLWNYPRYSTPFKAGKHLLYYFNDGLRPQSVLYIVREGKTEPEVLIDPNTFSEDGTISLSGVYPSRDGKYIVYSVSESGLDWREFFVILTATGERLKDNLKFIKFSGADWFKDGFFYSRYDNVDTNEMITTSNESSKIYYHKIGTSQSEDSLVYEDIDNPMSSHWIFSSEDEEYLFLGKSKMGEDGNELYFKDLTAIDTGWRPVFTGWGDSYSVIYKIGKQIIVRTDNGAENYKLIKFDPVAINETITEIVPESRDVLSSVSAAGDKLFLTYMRDVADVVLVSDFDGNIVNQIKFPNLGNVWGFDGKSDDTEVFYMFNSYVNPPTIFKYNIADGKSEVYIKENLQFNPDNYESRRIFYKSKDGTEIPMYITFKKGITLDGQNPVLLYGYGGFNISLLPGFNISNKVFLDNGGVYAVANIRGGGEYGKRWHEQGTKFNKQNVFDDFIAAAEYLMEEGYTNPEKLAIKGGSNGGLLIGAVINQRPDLFKVAVPQVGVMDMLRFHKFTIGWGWITDFGSSDNKEEFEYLYKYSPLHNIKPDTKYPAILVTTSEFDDRVVPAHSFKYTAELQYTLSDDNLALIRIESKAGHGSGKPITKVIDEQTDIWAFIMYNLGMSYKRVL